MPGKITMRHLLKSADADKSLKNAAVYFTILLSDLMIICPSHAGYLNSGIKFLSSRNLFEIHKKEIHG
jgi:hypothetical protein